MKVLVNCDRYPWPLDNGQNLRIWHYVQALRSQHSFDLYCWGEPPVPPELRELFGEVRVFPRPEARAAAGLFLAFQYPLAIPGVTVANFLRTALQAHRGKDADMTDFRKLLKGKMAELEIDDAFAARANQPFLRCRPALDGRRSPQPYRCRYNAATGSKGPLPCRSGHN